MVIYGDAQSGNCYKVMLLLSLLEIDYQWHPVDIMQGQTQTPEFLKLNPNGKIPIAVFDNGLVLRESNALLSYFADGTQYLPSAKFPRAKVFEWLFFEQYSHEPFIAVARFIRKYQGLPISRIDEYKSLQAPGRKALFIVDKALEKSDFLVGAQLTIADISLYAYTHVADEGGFELAEYPNIQRWCRRIQGCENYRGIG